MLELHSLVAEQGEVSDSIADHVQNASEHVEAGNKQLKKATIAKVSRYDCGFVMAISVCDSLQFELVDLIASMLQLVATILRASGW